MPVYTYRCRECGRDREEYLPVYAADNTLACQHEDCGGTCVKVPSPPARPVVRGGTPMHYKNRGNR